MRYCKSKCAEKQEVNSALRYESCLSDNTPLLLSQSVFSHREVCALDVWLSKGLSEVKVKRELRNCNAKSKKCKRKKKKLQKMSASCSESEILFIDDYLSSTLECNKKKC